MNLHQLSHGTVYDICVRKITVGDLTTATPDSDGIYNLIQQIEENMLEIRR